MYKTIYTTRLYINSTVLKEWCFCHLGNSKRKIFMVPGRSLIMPPIVINSSLKGKFRKRKGNNVSIIMIDP